MRDFVVVDVNISKCLILDILIVIVSEMSWSWHLIPKKPSSGRCGTISITICVWKHKQMDLWKK